MKHPWKLLLQEITDRERTQKHFSSLAWKKVSEVNELIKWKRNITIMRDLILSKVLWSPEKYWVKKQLDYDYNIEKEKFQQEEMVSIDSNTKVSFDDKSQKDNTPNIQKETNIQINNPENTKIDKVFQDF